MNRRVTALVVALLVPSFTPAEIYTPPGNVRDPVQGAKGPSSDSSLPFLYLEPHDFCYDVARPLRVTLSAVNRSEKRLTLDWRAVVGSLVLEPVGPGRVTPVRQRPMLKSVPLASMDLAQLTIDLRDWFTIDGAGVYRLSYVRPLEDGRIHVAAPAQFVIEDDRAIEKLAAVVDAGPVRDTLVALLKDNPLFAADGGSKTYGWEAREWHGRPQMLHGQWDEALAGALQRWREGIDRLTEKRPSASHSRALMALVDRLLLLSDGFRVEPGSDFDNCLHRITDCLPPKEQERLHLKLVRSHSRNVVSRSMSWLSRRESEAALDELFRIGDGPDRTLVKKALSSLSNCSPNPRIAQYLRRKMSGDDRGVALDAAITSCYSGDGAGGALVVRCLKSADPTLRLTAIAQVVDASHFRPHRAAIVRALLEELKKPTSDAHLERAIESLEAYPSDAVLEAVKPFLKHQKPEVAQRAQLSIRLLSRD